MKIPQGGNIANKRFVLVANINIEVPAKIEKALTELVAVNAILRTEVRPQGQDDNGGRECT